MIICPRAGLVFVHIPKCAGTSVRRQIALCDDSHIAMEGIGPHPELGRLNYFHVGLVRLKAYFPAEYDWLQRLDSFAVVRDPLERFGSALRQYLLETEGEAGRMALLPAAELRARTLTLLDRIAAELDAPSQRFIVFARQADFILEDGKQAIDHLIPLDLVPDFIAHLSRRTGVQLDQDYRSNQNVTLRFKWVAPAAYWVNHVIWKSLPAGVHARLKTAALKVLSKPESAAASSGVLDLPEVREFVARHYAQDIAIHRDVVARRDEIRAMLTAAPEAASRRSA